MQPLQRSYSISEDSIEAMLQSGALSSLYDEGKVAELEEQGTTISTKDKKKLDKYYENKPIYDSILDTLRKSISDTKYLSPNEFLPVLTQILSNITADTKLLDKIADGLSIMDKTAEIQRVNKGKNKGDIIYDKSTKDTEIVKWDENIEDYMKREVLPHVPDAKWFWEEDMNKSKPVIKTGAEIPFTRYFYKYKQPTPSKELEQQFLNLEESVNKQILELFGGQ